MSPQFIFVCMPCVRHLSPPVDGTRRWHDVECAEACGNAPSISANVWLGSDPPRASADEVAGEAEETGKEDQEEAVAEAGDEGARAGAARKRRAPTADAPDAGSAPDGPPQRRLQRGASGGLRADDADEGWQLGADGGGAGGGDALSRVSEAITRVVLSALFAAATASDRRGRRGGARSRGGAGSEREGAGASCGEGEASDDDASEEEALNMWLNPTEEFASHG